MRVVDSSGFVFGEIDSLPGCSQIAVSHAVFCKPEARNKGFGDQAHKERLKLMQQLGYNYAICTVDRNNTRQTKILQRNNWRLLEVFKSNKTEHLVEIYGKHL